MKTWGDHVFCKRVDLLKRHVANFLQQPAGHAWPKEGMLRIGHLQDNQQEAPIQCHDVLLQVIGVTHFPCPPVIFSMSALCPAGNLLRTSAVDVCWPRIAFLCASSCLASAAASSRALATRMPRSGSKVPAFARLAIPRTYPIGLSTTRLIRIPASSSTMACQNFSSTPAAISSA